MNNTAFTKQTFGILTAAILVVHGAASGVEAPVVQTVPCTYVGRLMDAEHVAFDDSRKASIVAYDASGNAIAASSTFYKSDSRRNYALNIPMASSAVDGALPPGAKVTIEVTDSNGDVWSGVVTNADATLSAPGSVKEVDIVLASCTNGYGLDDSLYDDLYWAWRWSRYYVRGEKFDPTKDYDGDGTSTHEEALAGTNPFDPDDKFAIVSFRRGEEKKIRGGGVGKDELAFTAKPGRAYSLEVSESLDKQDWKPAEFYQEEDGTPVNVISIPATGTRNETPTIFLLPVSGDSAFFRIRQL